MNPIVVKEFLATARSPRFFVLLMVCLAAGSIMLVIGPGRILGTGSDVGQELFWLFFAVQAGCVALAIPAYAATSICLERERRTFEYLLLTELSPAEIVIGKFGAAMSYVLTFVVAFMPLSATCFLYGGVGLPLLVWLYLCLLLGSSIAAMFCVRASADLKSPVVSVIVSYFVTGVMALIWVGVIGFTTDYDTVSWIDLIGCAFWTTPISLGFWLCSYKAAEQMIRRRQRRGWVI